MAFFRKFSEADFKNKLAAFFPNYHFVFTDSGKSAFQLAIRDAHLENSEMILPAYICDVLRPILKHFNIQPIHLDTNIETFHANLSRVESLITPNTKSILICHTYGLPVEMNEITKVARIHNLKIIEDCAHIWPSKLTGDYAFLSLMKLFPTLNGGILISKETINPNLGKYRFKLFNAIRFLRLFPLLAGLSEKFRQEQGLIERKWKAPQGASKISLKTMHYYLDNLTEKTSKRIELAKYFQDKLLKSEFKVQNDENNTFTYLSALVPSSVNRDDLFKKLRKHNIFCSRIWQNPLLKQLPNTSEIADRIINFPLQSWFTKKDIDKIISCILSSMN